MTSSANRGTIYDTNGDVLAITADVQNVILSPRDVASSVEVAEEDEFGNPRSGGHHRGERETKLQDTYDSLPIPSPDILGIDREEIMTRLQKTNSAYEVLAEKVEDDVADQVRTFIDENDLRVVSTSPTIPSATIPTLPWPPRWGLCQPPTKGRMDWSPYTIWNCPGWMGGSSPRRTPGTELLTPYTSYEDAVSGYDVHTTIDSTIQMYAEKALEEGIQKFDVINGAFCGDGPR